MRISPFFFFLVCVMGLCAQQSSSTADPDWQVPEEAVQRKNPLQPKPELIAGGRKVFLRECAQCHGERGEGGKRKHAPNLAQPAVQEQSDGALFWMITNGNPRREMPAWSRLPGLQRWQLVLFLRTLKSD